jgi:hypothetical protein
VWKIQVYFSATANKYAKIKPIVKKGNMEGAISIYLD